MLEIRGECAEGFAGVRSAFAENFARRGEVGASVCVIHEGRRVVDLWAGWTDAAHARPWNSDTLVMVFSCTKGAVALCAHMLARRCLLELDRPIGHYWPQFACEGKGEITVAMLLDHTAGLPGLSSPIDPDELCDFDEMAKRVAQERPLWQPGARCGYHALTYGWLVGEVIRRASSQSIGEFMHREVAEALGIDFRIGLPAVENDRVAETIDVGSVQNPDFERALAAGEPIQVAAANARGGLLEPGRCDSPAVRGAEIPAANGITNARGLAGMYAPLSLGGSIGQLNLVGAPELERMSMAAASTRADAVYFQPLRYSAGFQKTPAERSDSSLVLRRDAFGHAGLGGAVGFADPAAGLAFGYAMNRHPSPGEPENARNQPLIDAAYRAVGYDHMWP